MIISETSFTAAVEQFKEFLTEKGLPTKIYWVFKEDIFSRNVKRHETGSWIRLPLPDENEKLAERLYKIGQQKNLGICLSAFALCEDKICAGVIIPKDAEDSEYLLMSPKFVKFSFVIDMPTATAVNNPFRWLLFKLLPFKFKQGNFFVYLESRRNLQFPKV